MTHRHLLGLFSAGLLLLSASSHDTPSRTTSPRRQGKSRPARAKAPTKAPEEAPVRQTPVKYHPPVHHASTCKTTDVFYAPSFLVASKPAGRSSVAADFNNDGLTDLLQSPGPGADLHLTLNKGNGAFAATVPVPGPGNLGEALATGDVNGDGYPDVFYESAIDPGTSGVGVAVGNGDGTFQPLKVYRMKGLSRSVVYFAVDLNHDKRDDLFGTFLDDSSREVTAIMLNRGDGSFSLPKLSDLPASTALHGIQAADFNGDGKMDIVTADDSHHGICVALGKGDGTLGDKSCATGPSLNGTKAVMVGDLNGDGKLDVVTANIANIFGATVYLNNGSGGFEDGVGLESNPNNSDGQLLDMDNDGKLDLALLANDGYVHLYPGQGDGTFVTPPILLALGVPSRSTGTAVPLLAGDFIGQGLKGLATPRLSDHNDFEILSGTCRTGPLPNPAPLTAASPVRATCEPAKVNPGSLQSLTSASNDRAVVAIDLNGDGKTDLLKAGGRPGYSFQYFLSKGDGTFTAKDGGSDGGSAGGIAAGDLNGDGFVDVVYSTGKGVAVALGTGKGTFKAPKRYELSSVTTAGSSFLNAALADINNDGKLDFITENLVVLGRGDGTFSGPGYPVSNFFSGDVGPFRIVDVNGDKRLDIVSVSEGSLYSPHKPGYCVSLNLGNSQFAPPVCSEIPSYEPRGLDLGDVNGDGKVDLVLTGSLSNQALNVFLGKGDGTFGPIRSFKASDNGASSVVLADVNNDGKLDAYLWRGDNSSSSPCELFTFLGNGDGTFSLTSTTKAGLGVSGSVQVLVGDFAGNGLSGYAVMNNSRPGFDVETTTCSP